MQSILFSLVIPTWSGTPELAEMALNLCKQVRPMCDELIITEDGDYCQALKEIVDVYLIHTPHRLGHARNLLQGLKVATGNYVGIIDSDIVITKGTLRS